MGIVIAMAVITSMMVIILGDNSTKIILVMVVMTMTMMAILMTRLDDNSKGKDEYGYGNG